MFVGTYDRSRPFVKVRQRWSSVWGGVVCWSFCLPIKAISLLKSPHNMCMIGVEVYLISYGILYGGNERDVFLV